MSLEPGQKLSAYEIIEPLGAGGMGEVYRARDTKLDRDVAIKVLPPAVASNTERRHRFEREAKTVAALNHPNIVTIYGIEEADGHYFIAMELVQGETLDRLIPQAGMPLTRIFDLAVPLADALTAAHEKGIVHRDLKPGNVMVTKEGRVKILDFGLAKLTTGGLGSSSPDAVTMTASLTGHGMIVGTVPYMSPEQLRSAAVDHRTDIFSLGIMLYQMATGHRPFRGEQSADVMSSILRDTPRPLYEVNTSLPRHLGRIVRRCLDKDPEQRYQSAKEVRNELRLLRKEVDSGDDLSESQETSAPAAAATPPSSNASLVPSGSTMSAPTRRGEFWIGVAAVIVVLVAGIWYVRETITSDTSSATRMQTRIGSDSPADTIDSLAVLPFAGDSADEDTAFLGDGIAESVINRLISIPALHVVSRNTAFRHRGRENELESVARDLNVRAVLTGTVFKRRDRLMVSVALEDMLNREQIWGERFDRKMADILTLERDIADKITAALKLTVTGEMPSDRRAPATENPDARLAYMQGRFWWNKRTSEGFKKSIEYYDRAIDLDPAYALPYAGKATTYVMLAWYTHSPKAVIPLAKRAAERAIALDPDLAEAYTPLAWIQAMHEWDWSTAEQTYRKAIDLNPRYETARHWYGVLLTALGRFDEAEVELREALRLDPGSLIINRDVAIPAMYRRDFGLAEQRQHQAMALYPNNLHVRIWLCRLYLVQRRLEEGVASAREIMALDNKTVDGLLGYILGLAGRRSEALEALSQLEDIATRRQVSPTAFAMLYAGLGDMDRAFEYLDQAIEERDGFLALIKFDPIYNPFRRDPRFDKLLDRIGFPSDPPAPVVEAWKPVQVSLAVLPFDNVSDDPDTEYLSNEIPANIIDKLSGLSGLSVISRSGAFRFDPAKEDASSFGKRLGASAVLTGQLNARGDRLTVRAELVDATTNQQLWSQRYPRELTDIMSVEEEIVQQISDALKLTLTGAEQTRLTQRHTHDAKAYREYLQGRFWWNKRVGHGFAKALEHFQNAIDRDPQYARALAGLADTHILLGNYEAVSPDDAFRDARKAAQAALRIDETLAEAHVSLGGVQTFFDWDSQAAEASFRRAIELNPNYPTAYHWLGFALALRGDLSGAIQALQDGRALDPMAPIISTHLGSFMRLAGRYDEAESILRDVLELEPDFVRAHEELGSLLFETGRLEAGVAELEAAYRLASGTGLGVGALGAVYAHVGRREDARSVLAKLEERSRTAYVSPVGIAAIHTGLGNTDEALAEMDQALARRDPGFALFWLNSALEQLLNEPRMAELMRRGGITPMRQPPELKHAQPIKTRLAVLPFENVSDDPDTKYLSNEIPANIIDKLSGLSGLSVISRSGAFRFDPAKEDASSFGKRLGASAVLTGQLNARSGSLTIRAELVDVATNQQIWSKRYPRQLKDIMAVEADITQSISDALRLELSLEEETQLAKSDTRIAEAYRSLLQGRFFFHKFTAEGWRRALGHFQEAVRLDPAYALAHAELSKVYSALGIWFGDMPPGEAAPKAKKAALTAIALDDSLSEAHGALAFNLLFHDWDWSGAEEEFLESIRLSPRSSEAHLNYAILLRVTGRLAEAEETMKAAQLLDPTLPMNFVDMGATYAWMGRNKEGIEQCKKALDLDPQFPPAYLLLGEIHLAKGEYDEAVAHLEHNSALRNRQANDLGSLGSAYALAGQRSKALAVLDELRGVSSKGRGQVAMAKIHASLGNVDAALASLEAAFEQRDPALVWVNLELHFEPLRGDPRFDDLLRRMGFERSGTPIGEIATLPKKSRLAILPFDDHSPEPQAWLASGLADLVSMRLGRINPSKLGVVGPQSTTYYAQPGKSIQDLREELKVEFVLSGSIQTIGNDVRITASLINADNSTLIWSEEFKGTMDDSFALQSMVAEKIMAGLPVELTGDDQVRWKNRYVPDPTAELAYMRGRYFAPWAGRVENQSRAVSYFEQAIEKDPQYALAYCGLADTKCFLATWGTLQTSDIRGETMETVTEALALDDTLAEAHTSAGLVATFVNWDWAAAEAAFERAIELNPNIARTYDDYGRLLAIVGRYDEAEERYQQAIDLNPVSSSHLSGLGVLYAGIGRLEEADTLLQEALEFDEKNPEASVWLADVRQKQGRFDDAVKIMERAVFSVDHPELAMRSFLGIAYAMAGRIDDARKQLAEMHESKEEVPGHHVWFAELYAALGEKNEAFRRLDLALAAREAWLPHVRFDPGTVSIRSDPRFAELHRKMGIGDVDLSYAAPESVRQSLQLQPRQPQKARVAILPFTDNSPRPELKPWLASGLADKISTQLGRVNPKKLGVLGPEITKHYAQTDRPIQNLRADLTVDSILSGSIQAHGNDVSITARLINAHDQTSVWSDEFKGTMDDPFALQSKVAEKIIAGLPFQLTGEGRARWRTRYVPNPKAELAYMQGRFFGPWNSVENLSRAVSYFEKAIEIDPEYPLPYCGLVNAKCGLTMWGTLQTSQIRREMEDAAAKALALDDTLPEAHVSAAFVATYLNWDWPAAEVAFERAIQLNPNIAGIHHDYGFLLVFVGRYDEAIERHEKAIELNPASASYRSSLGMLYAGLGRLDEAEQLFNKAFEFENDSGDAVYWLADIRQKQGRFDDAVEIMERFVRRKEKPALATRAFLGNAYAMAGRLDDARKQLAMMLESELPGHHMWFGELHAALGEVDEAFRRLDQAFEAREAWLPHIRLDPGLIHIRSDPRFAELHRKMGLGHVDLTYAAPSDWRAIDPEKKTMLAVLPFANLSGDPQQEYFSDGMTEEMITRLGKLRPDRLGVIARTSAMRYKRTSKTIDQIGGELGVDYVIEGGVRRAGDSVRINAQLIQVSDQTQIWGDSYTRNLSDVFAIQAEVAEAVAASLAVELLPGQAAARAKKPTDSSAAHNAYLLGRHYWAKRTPEGLRTAIEHFERAVEFDPDYALAHSGLADAWGVLPYYVDGDFAAMYAKAKRHAEKALAIDDSLSEAHVSMALVFGLEGDFEAAFPYYRKAIEIDPNNATARQWHGFILCALGRGDEGLAQFERGIALEPMSPVMRTDFGDGMLMVRRFDKSIEQHQKALELEPDFLNAHKSMVWSFVGLGRIDDAAAAFEKLLRLRKQTPEVIRQFRQTHSESGLPAAIMNWLAAVKSKDVPGLTDGGRAALYAWCGEIDTAFELLDRALAHMDPELPYVRTSLAYDRLRDDPRWNEFLRKAVLLRDNATPPATTP